MAKSGSISRWLAAAAAFTLVACGNGGGTRAQSASGGSPQIARIGQAAPDWKEPMAPTGTLALSSLRGHPVYLNFFATWCPPCNDEAPAIDALQRKYASRGLDVVGVDVMENAGKAAQFRREHHLSYPAVVDDGTLRDQYRINGLPVHVFIDRGGIVRAIEVGQLSPDEMRTYVLDILGPKT
jgi:cytochrome c biogenesis protein CcmG, thiol:disulfide interchange protein DsbE